MDDVEYFPMDITAISDLHGNYPKDLPGGDLLIIAGDLTASDKEDQYWVFHEWIEKQDYKKKIVIAGNHDNLIQKDSSIMEPFGKMFDYLCDSGTEFMGYRIWGSPWTKTFPGMNPKCKAFTVDTEEELADKWSLIPDDIDILITHSPLVGFGDVVKRSDGKLENVGSYSLKMRIWQMEDPPKLIVTGHIHEGYGTYKEKWHECCDDEFDQIIVNASHVNERYQPVNKAIRIIL